ncbi:MAG: NUDIX domain-containing protein [Thermoleophilaceae bacterium]
MRSDHRPGPGEELNAGEVTDAREAASLILLRDTADGPEVLLVRRNPEQRFMGGAWVFPGGSTDPDDGDELRTAIRELEEEAGIELSDGHELVRFSRWITPAQVKVRFDTHFFVAEAPEDAEPTVDGSECVDWRWLRPRRALELHRGDELMLVFPTIKHLEQLERFRSVSDALETARASRVLPIEPRVLVEGGVAQVVLPGEPGYER